jgi:oligopeptidase B
MRYSKVIGSVAVALLVATGGYRGTNIVNASELQPPKAVQRPHVVRSPFGDRADPWYWLRDDERKNPEMLAYLEAENDYMKAVMAPHRDLEQKVYDEIVGRLKQDDASVPQRRNGYWYYSRYETGKQYPIYARRKGSLDAPEEVLIDGNARAQGHDFYQLAGLEVSLDGRWAAVAEDTVGRRQYEIRIKDLTTGEFLPEVLSNVEPDIAWANDNRTFVYIRKDPQTLLGNKVYRHERGANPDKDSLVYEQEDESFYMGVEKSKSDRYIYIASQSTVSSEYRYADANDPKLEFRVALARERDHEYQLEDLGDRFIIRTNWQAKNFRIVEAPKATVGDRKTWKDIVAHRDDAFVGGFDTFDNYLAVSERSGGLQKLRVRSWDGKKNFLMEAADAAFVMSLGNNAEQDTTLLRYVYTSPTTPASTYDYDMTTGERRLLKQEPVLGGFDASRYTADFRFATARDGRRSR